MTRVLWLSLALAVLGSACAPSAGPPAATAPVAPTASPAKPAGVPSPSPMSAASPSSFPSPSASPSPSPAAVASEADEYAVYSAVIDGLLLANLEPAKQPPIVVIRDQAPGAEATRSSLRGYFEAAQRAFPGLAQETVDDALARNQQSLQLRPMLTLSVRYALAPNQELEQLFAPGRDLKVAWQEFYDKYPGARGVQTLSRPGFNRRVDQALVYVASNCGPLCGVGQSALLVRRGGGWSLEAKHMNWVS